MSVKPSESEEEYFARQEFERRKAALADQTTRAAKEERERILAVAKGRCPKCAAPLVEVHYHGVELDKCSECGGVWLDVGELEQVAEKDKGFLTSVRRIFG
jgi:hypothetical protein